MISCKTLPSTFLMKLFKTGSIDVVNNCQSYFAIDLPSCDLKKGRTSLSYDTVPQ